jgi:hypothetical protein
MPRTPATTSTDQCEKVINPTISNMGETKEAPKLI